MTAALIHRKQLKNDTRTLLKDAQVSPRAMFALYAGLTLALNMLTYIGSSGMLSTFISILVSLVNTVLLSGFTLYCMAVFRGERAEFLTLFDGFSFAGKVIALNLLMILFVSLWSMLFVIPGFIALYRYRYALYNLYDNPDISVFAALEMSKRQTMGYKGQLFTLDLSYIGWFILASVPSYIESVFLTQGMIQAAMEFASSGVMPAIITSPAYSVLPMWGWALISGIWSLVVGMFFRPHYQCVELGYFEIAKETSGIGNAPRRTPLTDGPDNMG